MHLQHLSNTHQLSSYSGASLGGIKMTTSQTTVRHFYCYGLLVLFFLFSNVFTAAQAAVNLSYKPPPLGSSCEHPLAWYQAGSYTGQYLAFAGTVHSVRSLPSIKNAPTFIVLGDAGASLKPLTLLVWKEQQTIFEPALVHLKAGSKLCVNGLVERHNERPQIVLKYAEQLRLPIIKLLH